MQSVNREQNISKVYVFGHFVHTIFWQFFLDPFLCYCKYLLLRDYFIYYYSHPLRLALHLSSSQRTCVNRLKELPQSLKNVKIKHQDAFSCTPTAWACIWSLIFTYSACTAYQISEFDTSLLDGCCYGYRVAVAYQEWEFFSASPWGQRLHQLQTQLLFQYVVFSPSLCLPVMWCFLTSPLPCAKKDLLAAGAQDSGISVI